MEGACQLCSGPMITSGHVTNDGEYIKFLFKIMTIDKQLVCNPIEQVLDQIE